MVRKEFGLFPATDEDMEKLLRVKKGEVAEVNVKVLRNYALLRKFWALVNVAWSFLTEAQQKFFHDSVDGFRCTLEVAAGYYDEFYDLTRKTWIQKPKSIAFDKMDEAEFSKLYEAVVNVIFKIFLKQVDKDEFYKALKDF